MNGKGDRNRTTDQGAFREGWDRTFQEDPPPPGKPLLEVFKEYFPEDFKKEEEDGR